jgi:hypothetical protein
MRKQLGFLDTEDQSEDLVDVGDDDDGLEWKVVKILTYRWSHNKEGRWAYRLRYICLPDESESSDDGCFDWPSSGGRPGGDGDAAWFNRGSGRPNRDRL